MNAKKIFILGFGAHPKSFWTDLLQVNGETTYYWQRHEHGLNNLTTVWPDVIIVEGKKGSQKPFQSVQYALGVKCKAPVFYISEPGAVNMTTHPRLNQGELSPEYVGKMIEEIHHKG